MLFIFVYGWLVVIVCGVCGSKCWFGGYLDFFYCGEVMFIVLCKLGGILLMVDFCVMY